MSTIFFISKKYSCSLLDSSQKTPDQFQWFEKFFRYL